MDLERESLLKNQEKSLDKAIRDDEKKSRHGNFGQLPPPGKEMGRSMVDLPISFQIELSRLPVIEGIQILILYLEREVMRWEWLLFEEFRQPIVLGGKTGPGIEVPLALEYGFA